MPNKTVSIIIVTWNSAKYLSRCFDSVIRQTFLDYEVIVIDNGSKDSGVVNLEEDWPLFSLHVERLPDNMGFAVANNLGARLARGRLCKHRIVIWVCLIEYMKFHKPTNISSELLMVQYLANAIAKSKDLSSIVGKTVDVGDNPVYLFHPSHGTLSINKVGL